MRSCVASFGVTHVSQAGKADLVHRDFKRASFFLYGHLTGCLRNIHLLHDSILQLYIKRISLKILFIIF